MCYSAGEGIFGKYCTENYPCGWIFILLLMYAEIIFSLFYDLTGAIWTAIVFAWWHGLAVWLQHIYRWSGMAQSHVGAFGMGVAYAGTAMEWKTWTDIFCRGNRFLRERKRPSGMVARKTEQKESVNEHGNNYAKLALFDGNWIMIVTFVLHAKKKLTVNLAVTNCLNCSNLKRSGSRDFRMEQPDRAWRNVVLLILAFWFCGAFTMTIQISSLLMKTRNWRSGFSLNQENERILRELENWQAKCKSYRE